MRLNGRQQLAVAIMVEHGGVDVVGGGLDSEGRHVDTMIRVESSDPAFPEAVLSSLLRDGVISANDALTAGGLLGTVREAIADRQSGA